MNKLLSIIASALMAPGCLFAMNFELKPNPKSALEVFDLAHKGTAAALTTFLDDHRDTDLNKPITDFFNGYTPFHFACLSGNVETGKLLIDRGASVAGIEGQEPTPLMLAAASGCEQLCHMILDKDPSIKTSNQAIKAMERAIAEGHANIVHLFINAEVPCDLQQMLHVATENGQQDLADLFIAHGAKIDNNPELLLVAVHGGLIDIVHQLLDAGTPVNGRNYAGCSLLNLANDCLNSPTKADKKEQYTAICKLLTERGGIDDVVLATPITDTYIFRYGLKALPYILIGFNLYRAITDTCCCRKKKNN